MRIKGKDVDTGLREWINEELKSGSSKEYDLGKFFFTVSSGTIAFLLAAEKLTDGASWSYQLVFSFIVLLVAMIISLVMVVPKQWSVDEFTDLFDKRSGIIVRTIRETYLWFALWLVGVCLGVWAVFY